MTTELPGAVARVAVDTPLRRLFDYLVPDSSQQLLAGDRVLVPFGTRQRVGVVIEVGARSEIPVEKLKPIVRRLDASSLLAEEGLRLVKWCARYYHHPIGEVVAAAVPRALLRDVPLERFMEEVWSRTDLDLPTGLGPRQRDLVEVLATGSTSVSSLNAQVPQWREVMRRLRQRGLVRVAHRFPVPAVAAPDTSAAPVPSAAQRAAVDSVAEALDRFVPFLLQGVTGSGKTEVYLRLAEIVLARQQQVLMLVPEIGLTTQLVDRVNRRLGLQAIVLHSAIADATRTRGWLSARTGHAAVVVGTRSAVWTPMPRLGLIIIDEEHDSSYKQGEGLRYSARDLALVRGRDAGIPVVMGSATPSLESLFNVREERFRLLRLDQRASGKAQPKVAMVTVDRRDAGRVLAPHSRQRLAACLEAGQQALVFINRRGFAPVVYCHECAAAVTCRHCDAPLVYHQSRNLLLCHHCGWQRPFENTCLGCGRSDPVLLGSGTQRLESELNEAFPGARVLRIDRDAAPSAARFAESLARVHEGEVDIVIGTEMVSKGHDFSRVGLVVVVDADRRLFSTDFRAPERLAQTVVQVAGRAGRGEASHGEVLIQTSVPNHPYLQLLTSADGYDAFARHALTERDQAELPPFVSAAVFRAEDRCGDRSRGFLAGVSDVLQEASSVQRYGPAPCLMVRRAGYFRYQLLLIASQRSSLQRALAMALPRVEKLPEARQVRWSLDVDPSDFA